MITRKIAVHRAHCHMGEYEDSCKYGDPDCPVMIEAEAAALVFVEEAHASERAAARVLFEHSLVSDGWIDPPIAQFEMQPLTEARYLKLVRRIIEAMETAIKR